MPIFQIPSENYFPFVREFCFRKIQEYIERGPWTNLRSPPLIITFRIHCAPQPHPASCSIYSLHLFCSTMSPNHCLCVFSVSRSYYILQQLQSIDICISNGQGVEARISSPSINSPLCSANYHFLPALGLIERKGQKPQRENDLFLFIND